LGDPYVQGTLPRLRPVGVPDDVARHPVQPRTCLHGDVAQPPPCHDEDLRQDVFDRVGWDPATDEGGQLAVVAPVQLLEPRPLAGLHPSSRPASRVSMSAPLHLITCDVDHVAGKGCLPWCIKVGCLEVSFVGCRRASVCSGSWCSGSRPLPRARARVPTRSVPPSGTRRPTTPSPRSRLPTGPRSRRSRAAGWSTSR